MSPITKESLLGVAISAIAGGIGLIQAGNLTVGIALFLSGVIAVFVRGYLKL